MSEIVTVLDFDAHVARELSGELGAHLKVISDALGVRVTQRGTSLRIVSEDGRHEVAARLLEQLGRLAEEGRAIHPNDVKDGLRILDQDPGGDVASYFRDVLLLDVRRRPIVARSANQRSYIAALRKHEVVFGVGPAGTGKTWLAMALAISHLRRGAVRRIVLTRPAVEAGEKLGFLPGDLTEKVDPYLRPLFDALSEMVEPKELSELNARGAIEVAPLAFMRGRTLNDAFVVLDEAQNTTVEQMKMFLTRLGASSRMVITGDPSQVDLPRGRRSGLGHAVWLLEGVEGISVCRMTSDDVVRHPLVGRIIDAYDRDARQESDDQG